MTASRFLDRTSPPSGRDLEHLLGPATALWGQLLHDLATGVPVWETWRFTDRKRGWRLRLARGDGGAVLYLTPQPGCFLASFGRGGDDSGTRVVVRNWRDLVQLEDLAAATLAS
jgi:hypothetical protein